jgi:hypothetical protein
VNPKNPRFFVPVRALSVIFRAKFRSALKKADLLRYAPGRGVARQLARYVFRIALANSRLESIEGGDVRFGYRDNRTQQIRRIILSGVEFLRRFLQHVLPRGVAKVRYYGIFSPSSKAQLERARLLLSANSAAPTDSSPPVSDPETGDIAPSNRCPLCHMGALVLLETLPAERSHSP